MKNLSKIIYSIQAVLLAITIFAGFGEVKENLEGWHGYSSGHAFVFVLLCGVMIALCAYNIITANRNDAKVNNLVAGGILVALPIIFKSVATNLQGNVESDFQYLMLRTFQGFDKMFVLLLIVSIVSFVTLLINLKKAE